MALGSKQTSLGKQQQKELWLQSTRTQFLFSTLVLSFKADF